MKELFVDQVESLRKTREALGRTKRVLLQGATGSGKTVITAEMIGGAARKSRRSLMTMPRVELMKQSSNTFRDFEIPHSYVAADMRFNPESRTFLATTPTLANRIKEGTAPIVDLLVVDETHYGAAALDLIINYYTDLGAYIVGLSATPWRMSGKGLGCWYDEMVEGPTIRWLIDNKRLSDYRLFMHDTPDLSRLNIVAGDYAKAQLAQFMEEDRVLIGNIADTYMKTAMGKLNITFGVSRKHARLLNESFLARGIPSAYVDGDTPEKERTRIFRALAKRELLNVCNVELLTFGFDLSAAADMPVCIESLSIGRPTKSLALWRQILGRGLRYKDYPAILNDHSGNAGYPELGAPDAEFPWTLEDSETKSIAAKVIPARQCPKCGFWDRPKPVCSFCQYQFPVESRQVKEADGELVEMTPERLKELQDMKRKSKRREQGMAKTPEELLRFLIGEGSKNPVARAKRILGGRGLDMGYGPLQEIYRKIKEAEK